MGDQGRSQQDLTIIKRQANLHLDPWPKEKKGVKT